MHILACIKNVVRYKRSRNRNSYVHIRAQNYMSLLVNFFMLFALLKNNEFALYNSTFTFKTVSIHRGTCMGNSKL